MTPRKMQQVREAVEVLGTLSDSEWKEIFAILVENQDHQLEKGSELSEEMIYEKITRLIHYIGVPAHIKGYHYFKEAIFIYYINKNCTISMTKELYPRVAQKFNTTSSRVERAIRHAVEVAWDRGNCDIHNKFFGYTIDPKRGKPTNAEAIAMIANYLK